MAPPVRFPREDILRAALSVVREKGIEGMTARAVAAALSSSVRPIFSIFQNMDDLIDATVKAAGETLSAYIKARMERSPYPPYKAIGLAYVSFAGEEKELFKLLFMRDRSGEREEDDRQALRPILRILQEKMGISEEEAYRFHIEMWIFVHGMAAMAATSYLTLEEETVSLFLTDMFEGLSHRFKEGKI